MNLSVALFDGTHTPAKRGGEQLGRRAVAYQGRKKCKTSNTLWLTDADGLTVGFTVPIAGNHHDVKDIRERLEKLIAQLAESGIRVEGLFINADAGFDSYEFREACEQVGIQLNAPDNNTYFDELMYEQRFKVERTNAWMDSNRTLLVRQDTSIGSWIAWHYIFCVKQWINHLIKL